MFSCICRIYISIKIVGLKLKKLLLEAGKNVGDWIMGTKTETEITGFSIPQNSGETIVPNNVL